MKVNGSEKKQLLLIDVSIYLYSQFHPRHEHHQTSKAKTQATRKKNTRLRVFFYSLVYAHAHVDEASTRIGGIFLALGLDRGCGRYLEQKRVSGSIHG